MDATIHYKVRDNHQIVSKAAYVVLGVNSEGYKDILGIWIGENESSKLWLNVLNELRSRGIKKIHLFCVDRLAGFQEAINAAFPDAHIQRCIIHQIRASTKYVSYKDIKSFVKDLKTVYIVNAGMEMTEDADNTTSGHPTAGMSSDGTV